MDKFVLNPTVGKKILQTLVLNLYNNPRCIYREYIQNAFDSINCAVKNGVLNNINEGSVSITILDDFIKIEDNGLGIKRSLAPQVLTDIANGTKDGIDQAGMYGIGRLSGGGYCKELKFKTSFQGENVATIVSLDVDKLRFIISDDNDERSAEKIIADIANVTFVEEDISTHYLSVEMISIVSSADILLNKEDIKQYIQSVAPVGYSPIFRQLIKNSPQTDFSKRHLEEVQSIHVSINNEYLDIQKPYTQKVGADIIKKLRYFSIIDGEKGELAWGWYGVTPFTVAIPQNDPIVGIRLRKHNISLDPHYLDNLFKEARGNNYFVGEIFISNDEISPDSSREGLAAGEFTDALLKLLRKYFTEKLHNVYTKANKIKIIIRDLTDYVGKCEESASDKSIDIIKSKLEAKRTDYNNFVNQNAVEEVGDVIDIYKTIYKNSLENKINKLLEKKEEVPSTETSLNTTGIITKLNDTSNPQTNYSNSQNDINIKPQDGHKEPKSGESSPKKIVDLFSQLENNGTLSTTTTASSSSISTSNPITMLKESGKFSEEQIQIAQQLFGLMNAACDKPFLKRLKELQLVAVKNLIKN